MTAKVNDGGFVFPAAPDTVGGMSLRDYFAAQAMRALIQVTKDMPKITRFDVAGEAYEYADAMIEASALPPKEVA